MNRRAAKLRWVAVALALVAFAGCASGNAAKKGFEAAKRGEWDAAVAYYREALAQDPKRIELQIELERATRTASMQHVARAKELEKQDQLAGAAAEYRLAVDFDPSNSLAVAKALEVERKMREQADAARPKSRMDELRAQAAQSSGIPRLDPRTPLPALRFSNTAIRDVLNTIGTSTGISVQYDQGLDGTIGRPFTVDLSGHTLESAFNMVLNQNTLTYKIIDSRTIFIYQDNVQNRQKYEDQYQQVFYVSHADVGEVGQILNQLLTTTTTGSRPVITQNKTANTIVARASAPMLGMIKNIIETNDKPKAEVLIEVTILEVDRQRMKDLGLDLSTYAIGLTFSPEGRPAGGAANPPVPANPIQAGNIRTGSGSTSSYITLPSAVINLMESDQKTRLLAKPQLRGREGSQLTLNLGDSVPVPQTTFLPVATGGVATQPQVSYAYQSIGVNLTITPKVTYNDEIILDPIMVDKSALGSDLIVAGQALPTFIRRSAQVSMRLRDGESNLLAGLIGQEDRELATSLPGINRIPVLRAMFGHVEGKVTQADIVMIVTPHIIRSREVTAEDLKPFYVGTQNNLGAGTAPALISQVPPTPPVATPTPTPTTGAVPVTGAVPTPTPTASATPVPTPTPTTVPTVTAVPTPTPAPTPRVVPVQSASSGPVTNTPPAQVLVTVPAAELQVGGPPYTVPVSITGASDVGAVTLTITYDPKVLKATAASPGTFMQQGGITPTFVPKIDEVNGRIDIAISRGANAPGAAGTNVLAGLVFQAVAPGTSRITVTGTAFSPSGQPLQLQFPVAGSVTVK